MNSWLIKSHRHAGRNRRPGHINTRGKRNSSRQLSKDHSYCRRGRRPRSRDSNRCQRVADLAKAQKDQRGGLGPVEQEQRREPVDVRRRACPRCQRRRGADLREQVGGVAQHAPHRRLGDVDAAVQHAGAAREPVPTGAAGLSRTGSTNLFDAGPTNDRPAAMVCWAIVFAG